MAPALEARGELERAGLRERPLRAWVRVRFGFQSDRTEDGVAPGRVTAEGEDVGVVGGDYGQCVRLSGQLRGPLDGSVEHHRLGQGQLGYAVVVAVIDSPSYKRKRQMNQRRKASRNPFVLTRHAAFERNSK